MTAAVLYHAYPACWIALKPREEWSSVPNCPRPSMTSTVQMILMFISHSWHHSCIVLGSKDVAVLIQRAFSRISSSDLPSSLIPPPCIRLVFLTKSIVHPISEALHQCASPSSSFAPPHLFPPSRLPRAIIMGKPPVSSGILREKARLLNLFYWTRET